VGFFIPNGEVMKLCITRPFYQNTRTFLPGLIVDLPAKQAQIILHEGAAVLAEQPATKAKRSKKSHASA
jgi:hypothetical protein